MDDGLVHLFKTGGPKTRLFVLHRHQELLDRQGVYANMWQQQLTAEQGGEE